MVTRLQLSTGKASAADHFVTWQFAIRDDGLLALHFAGRDATLQPAEWGTFVGVVKQRHPHLWRSDRPIPELGPNQPARAILRGCEDTPSYQLLLAGVDIVHAFRIMENQPADDLLSDFANRDHTIRSIFGPGGIYFVPVRLVQSVADQPSAELILQNKLGKAQLAVETGGVGENPTRFYIDSKGEPMERPGEIGGGSTRYYIPYAVPITLEQRMSPEANQLWDAIRTEYYSFRYPLSSASR